jgi:3-oxoacyl-[acyl-carrier protein] reductase
VHELGPAHAAATVDVTDESTVAAVFERTSPLDVVVNSAGFGGYGRINDLPTERFREVIDVYNYDPETCWQDHRSE